VSEPGPGCWVLKARAREGEGLVLVCDTVCVRYGRYAQFHLSQVTPGARAEAVNNDQGDYDTQTGP
jgi:hypothetical protein